MGRYREGKRFPTSSKSYRMCTVFISQLIARRFRKFLLLKTNNYLIDFRPVQMFAEDELEYGTVWQ